MLKYFVFNTNISIASQVWELQAKCGNGSVQLTTISEKIMMKLNMEYRLDDAGGDRSIPTEIWQSDVIHVEFEHNLNFNCSGQFGVRFKFYQTETTNVQL